MTENQNSKQATALVEIIEEAVAAGKELAKLWRENIGDPDPAKMHPFGDIIRGMNSQLKVANTLANRARRMLKPTDEITVRGIIANCLQACKIAYNFHDEQFSSYVQAHGSPANAEDLICFAGKTRSAIDRAYFRLQNFVLNPMSNRELAKFGQHVKEATQHVEEPRAKGKPTTPKTPE
jgi:hypothetical protein